MLMLTYLRLRDKLILPFLDHLLKDSVSVLIVVV